MNEENLSAKIIAHLGEHPKRWRTVEAVTIKRRMLKNQFRTHEPNLTPQDHAALKEYVLLIDLREHELTARNKKNEILNSDLFTPKEKVKLKIELQEAAALEYKKLVLDEQEEQPAPELTPEEKHKAKRKPEAFIPDWSNKPEYIAPLVKLGGVSVLTSENISCLIAAAGYGKSSICESILSSVLNKTSDCLGFETGESVQRALYIDIERTPADTWNSFYRMSLRAKIPQGTDISDKVFIAGLKRYTDKEARKTKIEELCETFKPQLLLIDGAAALVTSINDEQEAGKTLAWMFELTWRYNLGIITTLHPNKTTETPRGHLGTFLTNEAENMFIVRKNELTGIRTINTTKERNTGKAFSSFKWSDELNFMVSCEDVKAGRIAKPTAKETLTELDIRNLRIAFTGETFKYKELCKKLKDYLNEEHPILTISEPATKVFISDLQSDKVLIKSGKTPHAIYGFEPVQTKQVLYSNN